MGEGLEEGVPALVEGPVEDGDEVELLVAGEGPRLHLRREAGGLDGAGDHGELRGLHAAADEGLAVELARHPDPVEAVQPLDEDRGEAVGLEHCPRDVDACQRRGSLETGQGVGNEEIRLRPDRERAGDDGLPRLGSEPRLLAPGGGRDSERFAGSDQREHELAPLVGVAARIQERAMPEERHARGAVAHNRPAGGSEPAFRPCLQYLTHELEDLADRTGDRLRAIGFAPLPATVPELGPLGEAIEGGEDREHEAVHAVAKALALIVVGRQVAGEVSEHRLPGGSGALFIQAFGFTARIAVHLLQVVGQVVVGVVGDGELRIAARLEIGSPALDRNTGMEVGVVAEATFLQELRSRVAGAPAAVLNPFTREEVAERYTKRLELPAPLGNQAAELLSQPRRHPLVGVQDEDPVARGVVYREIAGGVEPLLAGCGQHAVSVTTRDLDGPIVALVVDDDDLIREAPQRLEGSFEPSLLVSGQDAGGDPDFLLRHGCSPRGGA